MKTLGIFKFSEDRRPAVRYIFEHKIIALSLANCSYFEISTVCQLRKPLVLLTFCLNPIKQLVPINATEDDTFSVAFIFLQRADSNP